MRSRKRKLFNAADLDGDEKLTKDELGDFLHPGVFTTFSHIYSLTHVTQSQMIRIAYQFSLEEAPHIKLMYVEHRMEDIDRNKDKFLTLSEYIGQCIYYNRVGVQSSYSIPLVGQCLCSVCSIPHQRIYGHQTRETKSQNGYHGKRPTLLQGKAIRWPEEPLRVYDCMVL